MHAERVGQARVDFVQRHRQAFAVVGGQLHLNSAGGAFDTAEQQFFAVDQAVFGRVGQPHQTIAGAQQTLAVNDFAGVRTRWIELLAGVRSAHQCHTRLYKPEPTREYLPLQFHAAP